MIAWEPQRRSGNKWPGNRAGPVVVSGSVAEFRVKAWAGFGSLHFDKKVVFPIRLRPQTSTSSPGRSRGRLVQARPAMCRRVPSVGHIKSKHVVLAVCASILVPDEPTTNVRTDRVVPCGLRPPLSCCAPGAQPQKWASLDFKYMGGMGRTSCMSWELHGVALLDVRWYAIEAGVTF